MSSAAGFGRRFGPIIKDDAVGSRPQNLGRGCAQAQVLHIRATPHPTCSATPAPANTIFWTSPAAIHGESLQDACHGKGMTG